MNPTEIIITGEKVSHPNLAGLSNKIAAVSDGQFEEKSIPASYPRGQRILLPNRYIYSILIVLFNLC